MHKFFSYFNTLTGSREISDTNRWTIGFNQVRTQGDTNILPTIKKLLQELNQSMTDLCYLYDIIDKSSTEQNKDIDFLLTENDFLRTGIDNIYLTIFNEPFEMLSPSLKLENKSYDKILQLLKTIYIDFKYKFLELEKKVNISQLNRLFSIMNNTLDNLINKLTII